MQAGVSPHAHLQPRELPVGEGPQGQVRLWRHLRQGVSGASPQGQRGLCSVMPGEIQSKFVDFDVYMTRRGPARNAIGRAPKS